MIVVTSNEEEGGCEIDPEGLEEGKDNRRSSGGRQRAPCNK